MSLAPPCPCPDPDQDSWSFPAGGAGAPRALDYFLHILLISSTDETLILEPESNPALPLTAVCPQAGLSNLWAPGACSVKRMLLG